MTKPLAGKVALITGANQGLGLEIARRYAEAGASLMLCARNTALLESACGGLQGGLAAGQRVMALPADVTRVAEIQAAVDETRGRLGGIDILVNNAGVYGPKGSIDEVDWEEWVRAIEINLMGSVLACRAVLPHFKKMRRGKIIQLSGGGATNPLPMLSAYAASKAAIVRFIETLAKEVQDFHIDVNAIAPGALNTRMLEEVIAAGPEKVGHAFYQRSLEQKEKGGTPLEKGAELAVFLGSSQSDGITGRLISAVWDAWDAWPRHMEELAASDAYTLRRITGRDRGLNWGDR